MNFLASLQRLDASDDPDLRSYFTKNAAIEELEGFESKRCLAVGLKGIGKTATYRYLTEFDRGPDVIVGVSRQNYKFFLDKSSVHWATSQSLFEDDLVMEALRAIIGNTALRRKVTTANIKAAKHLFGSYQTEFKEIIAGIGGVNILGVGFTRLAPTASLPRGLQLEKEMKEAREVLCKICGEGLSVRIVIDDPETIFQQGPVLDPHLLGGLFLGALRLSRIIPKFKVIVLLKTHIYHPVLARMEERDKFPSATVYLGWKREELTEVLAKRARWAGARWLDYFQDANIIAKICGNLRNGPRELLRWAELAMEAAENGKIDAQSIEAARRDMAEYALESLEAAFSDQYPGLGDVVRCLFRASRDRIFSREELENHIRDLTIQDQEMMDLKMTLKWLSRLNFRTLPNTLLETGVISFMLGNDLVLPYEDRYYDRRVRNVAGAFRLTPILADAV